MHFVYFLIKCKYKNKKKNNWEKIRNYPIVSKDNDRMRVEEREREGKRNNDENIK